MQITLASASPRRRELLDQIGVNYHVLAVNIDETPARNEKAEDFVRRLAMQKAQAGFNQHAIVQPSLGSDTIVVLNHKILGKPKDQCDAYAMLSALSGKQHQVMTAVAMCDAENSFVSLNISRVTFRELTQKEIEAYWLTGEPLDKAGAYAIQGVAAQFIEKLDGSYSAVMGLPLFETAELLKKFGIELLSNQ